MVDKIEAKIVWKKTLVTGTVFRSDLVKVGSLATQEFLNEAAETASGPHPDTGLPVEPYLVRAVLGNYRASLQGETAKRIDETVQMVTFILGSHVIYAGTIEFYTDNMATAFFNRFNQVIDLIFDGIKQIIRK